MREIRRLYDGRSPVERKRGNTHALVTKWNQRLQPTGLLTLNQANRVARGRDGKLIVALERNTLTNGSPPFVSVRRAFAGDLMCIHETLQKLLRMATLLPSNRILEINGHGHGLKFRHNRPPVSGVFSG